MTKREFVKQAAAVVTAAIAVPAVSLAPFDVVVYNDWHPQARAFAAGLSTQGVRTFAVKGDAGKLWYDTLRGLVGKRPCRIAGS